MAQTMVWLSYDLGVRGDYASLYNWLDSHKAEECGDSIAVFKYTYEGRLQDALLSDLTSSVEITRRDRLYAIFKDGQTGRTKGAFLHGNRRASAWTGYAADAETVDDELA